MAGSATGRMYRNNVSNPLPGFYRARIESNKDPEKLGRVRIRIPQCHGIPSEFDDNHLDAEDLPWAYPCMSLGAGYDYGSYMVPEAGEYVWIAFEGGDPNSPIYFGSCYGKSPNSVRPMGSFIKNESTTTCKASEGKWYAPAFHDDLPSDIVPSTKVIYKSPKGSTIMMDDADEHESLSIIDRIGQVLKFVCPTTLSANDINNASRRSRTVLDENDPDRFTREESYKNKTVIILKDLAGQLMRLVSTPVKSLYEIISQHKNNHAGVVFTTEENSAKYKLLAESDSFSTTVEGSTDDGSVLITVASGNNVESQISIQGSTVHVNTTNFEVDADSIRFSTSPTVSGEMPHTSVPTKWTDSHEENFIKEDDVSGE